MSFWSRVLGPYISVTPNTNDPAPPPGTVGEPDWEPGDPDGVEIQGETTYNRSLPFPQPSGWSGWPADWSMPNWQDNSGISRLVDAAWAAIDMNSSVLSSMPVYRLRDGNIIEPISWMSNPDPSIYTSWNEFLKQLFWDYHLGEAFVLCMARGSDNYPLRFRVIPPMFINVEMKSGSREYHLGHQNVTKDILHIRYQSTTTDAHGHGPLDAAGARLTVIGLLQRYVKNLAETGGVPLYWLGVQRRLNTVEAMDLLDQWIESRARHPAHPAIVSGGAELNQSTSMSAQEMAIAELSQFNESRIAVLLGVPPFLIGLAGAAGSLTYSNVESLFDFHDRSSLRPKATSVMSALSQWVLPSTQNVELNRDDYTRPSLADRFAAYKIAIELGILTPEEVRAMERYLGSSAPIALTGGID